MKLKIIEYDRVDEWESWFDEIISQIGPSNMIEILSQSEPEYIEDAADVLFQYIDKRDLSDHLNTALKDYYVRVFHGTRLSDFELKEIKRRGLQPLDLMARKSTLVNIFKEHPEWRSVESNLNGILQALGPGKQAGLREDGGIHVCFSRNGLLEGCNHYLTHGAEVDGHIAFRLFNDKKTALELLKQKRQPYLISFISRFDSALTSANPYGFGDDIPSLTKLFIQTWAYKKYDSSFNPRSLGDCTAAMFKGAKLPGELEGYEKIDDSLIIEA